MIKVAIEYFEDLSKEEQDHAPNNGVGKDMAHYLRIVDDTDNSTIFLRSDAMEPEDATFTRDLDWLPELIMNIYELGQQDH